MKKLYVKALCKGNMLHSELRNLLKSRKGSLTAEQGFMVAGVVALIFVVFSLNSKFAKDTFIPKLQEKIMDLFSMS